MESAQDCWASPATGVMSEPIWQRQPPPSVLPGVVDVWTAVVTTPASITRSRGRLHDRVRSLRPAAETDDDAVEALLLVFEELASNAVRHGRPPVLVTLKTTDHGWLIDVQDCAADCGPTPAIGRDPARGGLGLYLVARLSRAHGWWGERQQKHVWAWIRRAPAPAI